MRGAEWPSDSPLGRKAEEAHPQAAVRAHASNKLAFGTGLQFENLKGHTCPDTGVSSSTEQGTGTHGAM